MSNKGFTLAEVLVTLAVIGVVAALTIPTLMHNIEYAQYRTQAKTAYAIINQAMMQAKAENYDTFMNIFSSSDNARDTVKHYFNYVKECDSGTSDGNCWANNDKFLNGTNMNWSPVAGIILNNGMFIRFWTNGGGSCTETMYYRDSITGEGECSLIEIDTNGFKGPNVSGKDIFLVHVLKNKIIPAKAGGSLLEAAQCPGLGSGCLAKYLDGTL